MFKLLYVSVHIGGINMKKLIGIALVLTILIGTGVSVNADDPTPTPNWCSAPGCWVIL